MKSIQVSDSLHAAIKQSARETGRMLISVVAQAFRKQLGDEFPKNCREAGFIPVDEKDVNNKHA